MLEVERVSKHYESGAGRISALRDISFAVPRGQFVALMGPSGSGKSTLLHLIGGLDPPSTGTIRVGGLCVEALSDDAVTRFRRRHVGLVFQFFNLVPHMTALENVTLPLFLDGKETASVRARARSLLEQVGVADRAAHRPPELSGGEMQRVAIARALLLDPWVLLADEPTGSLDSKTGEEVLGLMRHTVDAMGLTILMATHDGEAAQHADRVLRLQDGAVQYDDGAVLLEGMDRTQRR